MAYTQTEALNYETELNLTRADRIRAALYPDSLPAGAPAPHLGDSALAQLAEPSRMLRAAITHLINYQRDASAALRTLPELRRLLQDNAAAPSALRLVHKLSATGAQRVVLAADFELVNGLVDALHANSTLKDMQNAAGALHQLSKTDQGLLAIFKSGGIETLLDALNSGDRKLIDSALSTLFHLLKYQDGAVDAVNSLQGLAKFIPLLGVNDLRLLTLVIYCIGLLSYGNDENKQELFENNVHMQLIDILNSEINYEKLIWVTTRLLRILSTYAPTKIVLVEVQTIRAVQNQFGYQFSERVMDNCRWILMNLSEVCGNIAWLSNIINYYLSQLFQNVEPKVAMSCSGFLSNVTCHSPWNKELVYSGRGVDVLTKTLLRFSKDEATVEAVLATLRHVTASHEKAAMAQQQLGAGDRLQFMVELLKNADNLNLVSILIGIVRHLTLYRPNFDKLIQNNVISLLRYQIKRLEAEEGDASVDVYKIIGIAHAIIADLNGETNEQVEQGTNGFLAGDTVSYVDLLEHDPNHMIEIESDQENEEKQPFYMKENSPPHAFVDTDL